MKSITIVIMEMDDGKCAVITDAGPPSVGAKSSPAYSVATDCLRICKAQANSVQYGQNTASLSGELAITRAAE